MVLSHSTSQGSAYSPESLRPFIGRTDVYAVQRQDGSYYPRRAPLTDEVLERHLAGAITIGAYSTSPDGTARWFVIDLDSDGTEEGIELARRAAVRLIDSATVPLLLEFSGRKGWHLWGLLAEPVLWQRAQCAPRAILEADGWTVGESKAHHPSGLKADLFPQGLGSKGLGAQVKLPLGVHRGSARRSYFLGPDGEPLNGVPSIELIDPADLPVPAGDVEELLEPQATGKRWDGELLPWEPWMDEVIDRGRFPEGSRNDCLHVVASWLYTRTDFTDAEILDELREVNAKCRPRPVPDRELRSVWRSARNNPRQGWGLSILEEAGLIEIEGAA